MINNKHTGAISGSRASTEPVPRLGPSGFDPERVGLAAEPWFCSEGQRAAETGDLRLLMHNIAFHGWEERWSLSYDNLNASQREEEDHYHLWCHGFVEEAFRQWSLHNPAIAMEARQGTDPKGLDGEAATARASSEASPKPSRKEGP